jgi:exopolysaccharide/PEP-CTERM locus tyrosine autokinase
LSKIAKALEKAKQNRQSGSGAAVERPARQTARPPEADLEIKPKYSTTRTIEVDERLFEANFVLLGMEDAVVRDRYNLLRTQLLQRTKEQGWNTIMITSGVQGEGKTVTAINLALSMARESQQTSLLVDANFRSPKIEEYMGLGGNKGLTDHMLDDVPVPDILINPGIEKLVVVPPGTHHKGAADLLGSPKLKSLVKDFKTRYPDRYVIYDCPHILDMPDSLVFSTYVDAVVLVVDQSKTTKPIIDRAIKMLDGRNVVGIVLNKSR